MPLDLRLMMATDSPSLRAIPFHRTEASHVELLSPAQQTQLARHAVVHKYPARTVIYNRGENARSVFLIDQGVVKSFRDLPSGRRRIAAFLFARDLFGLAEAGRYVNTVQAITPVRLYEIDVPTLTVLFRNDEDLELQFLCKTVHVLREAQHHNIVIGRRDAVGRVAMFIEQLIRQDGHARAKADVEIPMSRSDVANYLGLSLEAVVRACGQLERQRIVEFSGRHRARIVDRRRFEALARRL